MDKSFFASMARFALVFGLSWFTAQSLMRYFSGGKAPVEQVGQVSIAADVNPGEPVRVVGNREDLYKPLNFSVDASDAQSLENHKIVVDTSLVRATFSTVGAILEELSYKHHTGKDGALLNTVLQGNLTSNQQQVQGCLLVATDQQTPMRYRLVKQEVIGQEHHLVFRVEESDFVIKKHFILYNDSYRIDTTIEIIPLRHDLTPFKPRVFLTSPFVSELIDDEIDAFVLNEHNATLEKKDRQGEEGYVWYWNGSRVIFGAEDKYFAHALVKDNDKFVQRAYMKRTAQSQVLQVLEGPLVNDRQSWSLSWYFGPKVYDKLAQVDEKLTDLLSFGWLSWICIWLLKLLDFLVQYLHNYGFAIIALTILIRLPLVPLSLFSRRQMESYQKHQPAIQKIRTKYRNDTKMQQQELIRYHHERGLSPAAPLYGCLLMILPLPILYAFYRCLGNYVNLYQAPFAGWIKDLSLKDPYYILPILMGVSMIWQQLASPVQDEKQRVVMLFMSIVMTVVFAGFPAGLVLYWLVNNLLAIGEDYLRKALYS